MESIIREESHWREYALGKEHRRRLRILQEWQECTGGMRAGEAKKQPQEISPSDGRDASSTHPTPPSTETSRLPIPPDLESKLFQHQIEGIQWLHGVMTAPGSTAQGCILADEMGLGKTIQCSTYIGATLRRKMFRNVLIVVPPTLISNWVEELEKWALLEKEKIITIRCETRKERAMLKKPKVCLQGTVVVTSYGIIVSDVDKWIENGVTFDLVVLDEGHTIKNPATKTTQACRKIPSRKRLLMTGTPVMNNLQELHALFHFVDSEILSCSVAAFSRQVSAPITEGMLRDASDNDVLSANQRLVLLREKIAPYFLRRTKSTEADAASTNNVEEQQHGDEAGEDEEENEEGGTITREISSVSDKGAVTATPAKETNNKLHCVAKQENVVWIPLTEKQQALYLAFLEKPEVQIAMTLISTQKSVLCWLSSLKKLCDHTWLHMPTSEFQDQADNIGGRMSVIPAPPPSTKKSISNEQQQTLDDTVVVEDLEDAENADEDDVIMRNTIGEVVFSFGTIWEGSRKIEVAIKLLELHVQEKGEKCLVFSRSLRLLDILSWAIQSRFGVTAMRIDGSVKPSERQGLVKTFNEDPSHRICLLTTVVGGLGLTMVGANCVILMDPSWNPAVDAQAVDRVHRVGQTKDVNVYRLITCGTVEEKMYRRQIFKSVLAKRSSSATKENSHISSHFTKTELRDMFKLENTKNSNTHVQLVSLLGSHIAVDPTAHPLSEDFEMTIHSAVLSSDYASRVQPKVESTPAKRIRATRKEKATPSSVLSDLNADMNPETPSTSQRIKANHDEDDERPMGWMVGTTPQTATKQKKQTRRKEKGDDTTTQKKHHRGDKPEEGDAEAVERGEDNLDDLILRGMSLSINDKENTQPIHPTSSASKAAPAEKRRSTSPVSHQDTLLPVTQPTPTKKLNDPIPVVHVQGPASLSNSSTRANNDGFSGIRWVF